MILTARERLIPTSKVFLHSKIGQEDKLGQ
jgi:hypothetical protein